MEVVNKMLWPSEEFWTTSGLAERVTIIYVNMHSNLLVKEENWKYNFSTIIRKGTKGTKAFE